MSHVATIDIEIRDLDALDAACQRIGLQLVRDQKTYRWFGEHVGDYPVPQGFTVDDLGKCEHALRMPGDFSSMADDCKPYEIGVVRRRDGRPGYTLMWDFFGGGNGLEGVVGKNCTKLKQSYAIVAAMRAARLKGFSVQESKQPNGTIRLVCSK